MRPLNGVREQNFAKQKGAKKMRTSLSGLHCRSRILTKQDPAAGHALTVQFYQVVTTHLLRRFALSLE